LPHRNKKPTASWLLTQRLLVNYIRPHLRSLLIAFCFMGIAAGMTGALAKLMEPIIDQALGGTDRATLYWISGGVLGTFLVRGLATYAHTVAMNRIGQRVVSNIQRDMLDHLLDADLAYFHANPSGQLISRIISDVGILRIFVSEALTGFCKSTLTLVVLVAVMFYQDWKMACVAFIAFPAGGLFVSTVGRRLRRVATDTQSHLAHLSAQLSQMFQASRHVKAYGMEKYESGRIGAMIERQFRLAHKGFRVAALTTPVNEVFAACAIVAVIIYGGNQVIEGVRTPGALFSFITAFLLAYEPLKKVSKANAQFQGGMAACERIFDLLDTPPAITDKPDAQPLVIKQGEVTLSNVTFGYNPDTPPALRNVSITAPAGKTIALVGASGAGKSTILNLIPRFYDVTDGSMAIDGQDVRNVTLHSLRSAIALVSQDIILFDDTVRANIAYGREGASDDEVIAAAKAAQAHDFILSLPNGYDTMVGELGSKISGGQRQRLVIARAMLKNAPILLLDEATSALDSESEKAVQGALKQLQEGRTTIIVAHRLSTIVDADCIYVMEGGRVVEQGTHSELLAKRGAYCKLYGSLSEVSSSQSIPA